MNEKLKEARKNLAKARLAVRTATENDDLEKLLNEEQQARQELKNARFEDVIGRMVERNEKHKGR